MATPVPEVPPSMRLFTVPEVMKLLNLGRNSVFDEIRTGRLKSVTVGRSRRIRGTAIQTYLDLLEQEAA
ncbi:helix-turn-helix domain-containing protein [Spirillospora sp. NPDC050679]